MIILYSKYYQMSTQLNKPPQCIIISIKSQTLYSFNITLSPPANPIQLTHFRGAKPHPQHLKSHKTMPAAKFRKETGYLDSRLHKYSLGTKPSPFQRNKSPLRSNHHKNSRSQNPKSRRTLRPDQVFGENFSDRRIPRLDFEHRGLKKS